MASHPPPDAATTRAYAILTERYPDYAPRIAQFVDDGETGVVTDGIDRALVAYANQKGFDESPPKR